MEIIVLIFLGTVIGLFCANIASPKGYSAGLWFWLGFFFSIFALIAIVGMPKKEKQIGQSNQS